MLDDKIGGGFKSRVVLAEHPEHGRAGARVVQRDRADEPRLPYAGGRRDDGELTPTAGLIIVVDYVQCLADDSGDDARVRLAATR